MPYHESLLAGTKQTPRTPRTTLSLHTAGGMKRNPTKLREWQQRSALRTIQKRKAKKFQDIARKSKPKQRTPLKKVSKSRAREMQLYYAERAEWLKLPKNAACAICLCLGETPRAAVECHHSRGRNGRLLRDQRFWIPSCRECRDVPHERPTWAREMGLLATAKDWNTYPE